ncbi:MAG: peptidoglycan DD-metalloendopeptidase family protein [Gemmatimonadetes bacterium]|jgi:septal ring factor EnvC (AmiA/AmiB activator)|nr:peptidoglycan DD-metalloendopeptidase family protein [Gemmatimonadota bacterium]
MRCTRTVVAGFIAVSALACMAGALAGQTDLRREILESQRRVEQIRAERSRLEGEIGDVRKRVRDASEDLANVERRLSASRSVLAEIQFQSDAVTQSIQETTRELVQAHEKLAENEAVLNRRLRDIYKMGPLHTVGVLLGASSFTDLLNRYRYLQRIASFDRSLVSRVETIEGELVERNDDLRQRMAELGSLRQNRLSEVAQLRSVESERQTALAEFRSRERQTASRLEELDADEGRMTQLIGDLETRRREIEARTATARADASLSADDAGSLDWPLDGEVIYRFGRERRPNGTVLRWNGIGISASPGSPVTAVRAGTVVLAGPFEGYGPTVVLSHGDGFYTLYLYLEETGVVEGRTVSIGQVVGTVGGTDTPEGPHIEFQVRAPVNGGSPQAQDPLQWLSARENE